MLTCLPAGRFLRKLFAALAFVCLILSLHEEMTREDESIRHDSMLDQQHLCTPREIHRAIRNYYKRTNVWLGKK